MQNMHPGLGAGVEEHSRFFDERWERLTGRCTRSAASSSTVTAPSRPPSRCAGITTTSRESTNTAAGITPSTPTRSTGHTPRSSWAPSSRATIHGCLTEDQKRRLFTEHIQWYRLYGMSMRPVPETWEAFQEYWDHMCRNVLEDNKATRDVLDLSGLGVPPFLPWLPDPIWAILRIPVAKGFVWLTVGMYDQPVRDLLGYSLDQARRAPARPRRSRRRRRLPPRPVAVPLPPPRPRRLGPRDRTRPGAGAARPHPATQSSAGRHGATTPSTTARRSDFPGSSQTTPTLLTGSGTILDPMEFIAVSALLVMALSGVVAAHAPKSLVHTR